MRQRLSLRHPFRRLIAASVVALVAAAAVVPARADAPLERMIGEMLMIGFPGTEPGHRGVRAVMTQMRRGRLGNVILFKDNVRSRGQLARLTAALQGARGSSTPALIAVDQEGGRVQRLSRRNGFPNTPSAAWVAGHRSATGAATLYRRMAGALAGAGVNVNFGPVVDLNVNRANPVIGRMGRSYGAAPDTVAAYAGAFVDAHRSAGVATALKHFPGHGSSRGDTHHGFVDVSHTWTRTELEPFRQLIANGRADMVMVAHVALGSAHAAGGTPASLDPAVIGRMLRRELGFDGVVVSDDMDMGALSGRYGRSAAAVAAVRAGVDLLIYSRHGNDPASLVDALQRALAAEAQRDPAFRTRIADAYRRVMRLKSGLGRLRRAAPAQTVRRDVPVPTPKPVRADARSAALTPARNRPTLRLR